MTSILRAGLVAAAMTAALVAPSFAQALDMLQLRTMLENMGNTVKVLDGTDAAPTAYEVPMKSGDFDIPVKLEISASGRYIWATAFLGSAASVDGARALALIKKNAEIQPSTFYITAKNNLQIGYAIDNRSLSPAHMKFVLEKLAGDVAGTSSVWSPPAASASGTQQ